ncbi:MAG: glycosyltransferase [Deltaproteobacteria bacterium]|nr:glycosyltransferase [Deltaproteobacteria bacterium]
MKIAITAIMPKGIYSGGRYHAYIMAECLAHAGNEVTFITNALPVFYDDFKNYPSHMEIEILLTENFNVCPGSNDKYDYVILAPTHEAGTLFYDRSIRFALKSKAKLIMLNFESANWFNSISPWKKKESKWKQWKNCCKYGCLVLSSAKESMKYAKQFYIDYKKYTRFDYWYPAINSFVADNISIKEKENRILIFIRLRDKHKGTLDIFEIINQKLDGYVLVFISGTEKVGNYFTEKLDDYANRHGFRYEIKTMVTDEEKFIELKKAKLVLFPSYFEGYGYPPVEAQYCESLCLVYDLPVLREVNKSGIIYCEYGNPSDMKKKLEQALTGEFETGEIKENISGKGNFYKRAGELNKLLASYLDDDWRNPEAKLMPSNRITLEPLYRKLKEYYLRLGRLINGQAS